MAATKIISILAVGAGMLAMATQAHAEEMSGFIDNPTFYVGGSAGRASTDTGVTDTTGTASLDEDDTAFKIFGGVNLNKYLAIEGFYADFGEASLSGNNGDTFTARGTTYTFTANDVNLKLQGKAFGIAPVVGYDVTEYFRPFAKVGIQRWDLDGSVNTSVGNFDYSETGTDVYYGVGALISVAEGFGIRAEAERFKFDSEDVDLISVGLQYQF